MPCLSFFQVNKCRVLQSTVSIWEIPKTSGSKSSAWGTPPREPKIWHALLFFLFSQAANLLTETGGVGGGGSKKLSKDQEGC